MATDRKQLARIGGLALAAQRDSREYTKRARAAFLDSFERKVDPNGTLSPRERSRRAGAARKLYFAKLAYQSAKARAKRKGSEQ